MAGPDYEGTVDREKRPIDVPRIEAVLRLLARAVFAGALTPNECSAVASSLYITTHLTLIANGAKVDDVKTILRRFADEVQEYADCPDAAAMIARANRRHVEDVFTFTPAPRAD